VQEIGAGAVISQEVSRAGIAHVQPKRGKATTRRSTTTRGVLAAVVLVVATWLIEQPAGQAQLSLPERRCLQGVAKAASTFVQKTMLVLQKCRETNLRHPGLCQAADASAKITALESKLGVKIDSRCDLMNVFALANVGYPGRCTDADPADGFTLADVKACMWTSHESAADNLIESEYGTTAGPLRDSGVFACQHALGKNMAKFTGARLKALQACRNAILAGKLSASDPELCATAYAPTASAITKATSKAVDSILARCADAQVAALDICDPNAGTVVGAVTCLLARHASTVDNLVAYEYAAQPRCGNNIVDALDEECDGTDAGACQGACGAPGGNFPCLCLGRAREGVIEHANADNDTGWSGQSHDMRMVEGGGYVLDLYDCDGPGGPDTVCTVGPSCASPVLGVNAPCTKDSDCGQNGPCRKERTAVGPHCNLDIQQACGDDSDCPGPGNFCLKHFRGPPLPLSAGGVSGCVVDVFSEDITGTTNLATGATSVRLRQRSFTHLGPSIEQPCPVCGGFCGDALSGPRDLCTSDADCVAGPLRKRAVPCVTVSLCSFGPNVDELCRPDPPFGGTTEFFGTTSVDCPPLPGANISGDGLDILFDPATTGAASLAPTVQCTLPVFASRACVGGLDQGRPCTVDSECAGGTCNHQCHCPGQQKPNDCGAACVGGDSDAQPCADDSQCPGGFCHAGDCRENPADPDGANEGVCTVGPMSGICSIHTFKSCSDDGDCQPDASACTDLHTPFVCCTGPGTGTCGCTSCTAGETCTLMRRECFVNGAITRTGVVHPTDPTSVGVFCVPATSSAAINTTAGVPGPGALRQPQTLVLTGF